MTPPLLCDGGAASTSTETAQTGRGRRAVHQRLGSLLLPLALVSDGYWRYWSYFVGT